MIIIVIVGREEAEKELISESIGMRLVYPEISASSLIFETLKSCYLNNEMSFS